MTAGSVWHVQLLPCIFVWETGKRFAVRGMRLRETHATEREVAMIQRTSGWASQAARHIV